MSGVRRVFAGVNGSLGSLQALRYAARQARDRDARLLPVIAWIPPGGDLAERRQPNLYLRKIWRDAAQARLWDAFDMGLGGLPDDLSIEALVVRGPAGPVLVDCADDPDDLLVIGTGRPGPAPGGRAFGEPLLRRPRALPRGRRAAVGPDGGGEPRPAPLAAETAPARLSTTPRRGSADAAAQRGGAPGFEWPDSGLLRDAFHDRVAIRSCCRRRRAGGQRAARSPSGRLVTGRDFGEPAGRSDTSGRARSLHGFVRKRNSAA